MAKLKITDSKSIQLDSVTLSRSEVASILNCSALTIGNREKSGKYPEPKRNDTNNYRYYTLLDVLNLQYIENGKIDLPPLLSVLHDKGMTDFAELNPKINALLIAFKDGLGNAKKNLNA